MIRGEISKHIDHDPVFRWQGDSVTRIENLSDIAFAVALGMIISGVDAPQNFAQLIKFLIFSIPAAAAFAVLVEVWMSHYTFFRRYGLSDARIILLNAILIFLVLYMAYPLRFAFDSLYGWAIGMSTGDLTRSIEIGVNSFKISGYIIAVFAFIYAACLAVMALMYGYVARHKTEDLGLNAYEIAVTKQAHFANWGQCMIAVAVGLLGFFTVLNGFAGFFLFFTFIPHWLAKLRYPSKQLSLDTDQPNTHKDI